MTPFQQFFDDMVMISIRASAHAYYRFDMIDIDPQSWMQLISDPLHKQYLSKDGTHFVISSKFVPPSPIVSMDVEVHRNVESKIHWTMDVPLGEKLQWFSNGRCVYTEDVWDCRNFTEQNHVPRYRPIKSLTLGEVTF